jgi:hypothetical protein
MTNPDEGIEGTHFLILGGQYYTAARCAALAQLSPVCGNIYHHAIEMLLKGLLSRTHSLEELSRRPFGHNLRKLWNAFKAEFPTEALDQFDDTITTLHSFERLRYPEATTEGAVLMIHWEPGRHLPPYGSGFMSMPRYQIVVTAIDHLVARIFDFCTWNPAAYTGLLSDYALEAITRNNPACGGWFPPQPGG